MELQEFFSQHPRVALAFSGGVDSAYLLYAAVQCGAQVRPYYVKTAFQPQFEYEDALRLADQLGVSMKTICLNPLDDPQVAANPCNRCYYCKRHIFTAITQAAREEGLPLLLDGTNASDQADDRPGMQALRELKVLSPLRLCGLTKAEIRRRSREAGLFTWDKPAYACLATRIPIGRTITYEDLARTEWAESQLMALGFTDLRVRLLGDCARVQLPEAQQAKFLAQKQTILNLLKPRYSGVLLDLEARNGQ